MTTHRTILIAIGLLVGFTMPSFSQVDEKTAFAQADLWKHARIDSPFGKLISTNIEVNGEQLQAVLTTADPDKADEYAKKLKIMYDTTLEKGCNADGIMYNQLDENHVPSNLSDGWGYNYVGYLAYDIAMGTDHYTKPITQTLQNLAKPQYTDYAWERESIDGYADSIEGGIYLLNRVPVKQGFDWVNQETRNNVVDHPTRLENGELWGAMKLQANGVRTTIMQALMYTQGLIARPWVQGLELGAAPTSDGGVAIILKSKTDYQGKLEFDIPRHRLYMGFKKDWPRMNTLPEWFVVEPEESYIVQDIHAGTERKYTGRQLHQGLALNLEAGSSVQLIVSAAQ